MIAWIDHVDATAENGDRGTTGVQSPLVSRPVDPTCQATDDGHSSGGQIRPQLGRHTFAIAGASSRTDDGHCRRLQKSPISESVQAQRCVRSFGQPGRVVSIAPGNQEPTSIFQTSQLLVRPMKVIASVDPLQRALAKHGFPVSVGGRKRRSR